MKGERVASMRASRVILLVEAIALHCRLRNYRLTTGNVSLLLLDEPFEGLAPAVTLELFKVFDQLRQHLSIVIVEHNLDLVLALADRVFALERGAVFHQGQAKPLLTDLELRKRILWL